MLFLMYILKYIVKYIYMADDNAHLKSGTGTHIFRLKGLRTKVFLQENPNYAPYDIAPVNASYFMDISINSLFLDDLIFISSASNYIDNSKWPDISFSMGQIKNSNKTDIDTYFVDKITKNIGPAWLAKNITGGYNNSDIFHNEDELVEQYVTMDKTLTNFNYLQISPTNLNKKLALNNVTITDITTNTPITLYSPDASGADFVTPGWEAGYEPSYALTGSDSEYLLYNTLDPSGVFIKYGFNTQIGHAYRINIKAETSDLTTKNLTVSIIDSDNNKQLYLHYDDLTELNTVLDSSRNFYIPNDILNTVYYSEPYTTLNTIYDNSHENINYTENIIAGQTQAATGWIDSQFQNSYPPKNLPTNFAVGDEDNTFIITNVTLKKNTNIGYPYQAMLFQIGNNSTFDGGAYKNFTLYVSDEDQMDGGLGTPNPNTQFLSITQNKGASQAEKRTTLDISDNTAPSTIIISIPKNGNLPIMLYQIKNGSIISYDAGARDDYFDDTFISTNNWFETIHIGGYNWGNSSSARKWKGSIDTVYRYKTYIPKLTDASTNIILYDNTIKSQLIKLLKRGGTSEANPTSGSNLQRYYVGKHNLGREIMLSMFAADNEATIDRINNILTFIPPPITYNVTLGDGTQGDNSGNTVFFLNGAETPVLNLTRGLNYEFNINGTDISKNKFIFTKQYDDGVDICLNPLDTTKVITSGLTYEINNSSVNFQEFNKQYETTFDVLHYIDIRPSGSNNSYAPPDNYRVIGRWPVGNVRLFNITTNSYVTIYPPTTDGSGNEYVRSGAWENLEPSITANERLAGTVADTNYSFSEWVEDGGYINHYRYIVMGTGGAGSPFDGGAGTVTAGHVQKNVFIRYGVFLNPNHEYRVHVSGREIGSTSVEVSYTNIDIIDQDFNNVLTVNPDIGFHIFSDSKYPLDASGIFQINPTNHVYPSDINERVGDIVTQRKIKWSVPFNEINVPTNSFYSSDISDNLGSNIIFNTNPIYGAMKFIDGDSIQFHLDYSQKSIVDSSGVALDSSGNKLGSNSVEDQDYIVRLKIHDLFHQPKLIAGSYDNSDNLITDTNSLTSYYNFSTNYQFSAGTNEDTRNWQNWVTLDGSGIYLNNEASGNILGLQFATDSDEFGIGISTDICNNIWSDKSTTVSDLLLYDNFNSNHIFYQAIDHTTNTTPIDLLANGISFNPDDSSSYTIIMKNVSVAGAPSTGFYTADGYLFNFSGILAARGIATTGSSWWGADQGGLTIAKSNVAAHGDSGIRADYLGEGFILEGPNPDDFQFNYNEPYTLVISFGTRSSGERTINAFQIKEDFSIKKKTQTVSFNFSSGYTSYYGKSNTAWGHNSSWSTGSNSYGDIYIYNGFINDISEILDFTSSIPKWPWEINRSPITNKFLINTNKFIWAFDASLNGNDYKYKIADTGGVIEDYPVDKLHNQKYNWKIEIKSDGKLCLKTSTDSALNVISSYSNIILDPDTRYYLWIGSKDASFNFTNLKYLPERKVFDDKVTLGPLTPTSTPGSTIPYNSYNVINQSESTTYITVADEILLVTVANSTFYINGNTYNDANPLELDKNKTYRFNLVNATNIDTLLGFSEDSGNATRYNNVTYNGTPGVFNISALETHLRTPYVDINISGADPSTLYYYDVNNASTTGGKINFT